MVNFATGRNFRDLRKNSKFRVKLTLEVPPVLKPGLIVPALCGG
jgi:hypothetical protein